MMQSSFIHKALAKGAFYTNNDFQNSIKISMGFDLLDPIFILCCPVRGLGLKGLVGLVPPYDSDLSNKSSCFMETFLL